MRRAQSNKKWKYTGSCFEIQAASMELVDKLNSEYSKETDNVVTANMFVCNNKLYGLIVSKKLIETKQK